MDERKKNLRQKKVDKKNLSKKVSPFVSTTTRKRKEEEEEEEDALCDDTDDQNDDDDDPAGTPRRARAKRVCRCSRSSAFWNITSAAKKDDDDGDHLFGAAAAYLDCREGNRDVERGDRDGEDFFHGRNVERG